VSVPVITLDIVGIHFDTFDTSSTRATRIFVKFQQPTTVSTVQRLWHKPCDSPMAEAIMFRISTIETDRERRLVVEGTLVRPWVDELRKTWSDAGNSLEGPRVVIDLTNVTVISREGENAIFDLMKEGAKFSCGGVLTRHLLKELAHRCHTRLSDVLNRNCSKK
jgi:hypothetical protein